MENINSNPGDPYANSYITIEEAIDYFTNFYYGANAWANATAENRASALKMATKIIDRLRFHDGKYSEAQALAFPRNDKPSAFGFYVDEIVSPKVFKNTSSKSTSLTTREYKYAGAKFTNGGNLGFFTEVKAYEPITGTFELYDVPPTGLSVGDNIELIPEIPTKVKFAQCEIALSILAGKFNTGRAKMIAEGVKSYSIGNVSETLEGGLSSDVPMPKEAENLLQNYISRVGYLI